MLSKKWIHYDAALKAERQMHYPGWFELFIIKTILYFPDKIRFFCQPIIFLIRIDCFDDAFTFFYSWSPAREKRLAAPSHQIGHKMTSFDFHLFLKAYFCIKHGAFFPLALKSDRWIYTVCASYQMSLSCLINMNPTISNWNGNLIFNYITS